nr:immunoglobulin heavy chain junction region [Mus musculus]MBK4188818.1 immunoglobulin heavy chain junction region [Mus musculus]
LCKNNWDVGLVLRCL